MMSLLAVAATVAKLTFAPFDGGVMVKVDEIGEGALHTYAAALAGKKIVTASGAFQVSCAMEKKVTHCEFQMAESLADPNYKLKVYADQKYVTSTLYPPYSREYASYFGNPNQEVLLQFDAPNGWLLIHGRQGAVISIKAMEKGSVK